MNPQQVMVITGTSRGIGYESVLYFLKKGYKVIGCSRGLNSINHANYTHYQVDVCDESSVSRWARQVKKDHGRIDVLVCNVGLVNLGAVVGATSLEMFRRYLDTNLVSTFLVCREFSKLMTVQRYGRIINISSTQSEMHSPGTCAYASSKQAVIEFTKVMANEIAEYGVTCNVVSPSLINTKSAEGFGEQWKENILKQQAIKRVINVEELCHVIDFFAQNQSSMVTGQVIHTCFID